MSIVAELTETTTTSLTDIPRRKFTIAEYHSLIESGVVRPEERIELWKGELIDMSPIGKRHIACVNFLLDRLKDLLGKKVIVSVQNPIVLSDQSEPQPDISLLKRRDDFYRSATATGDDTLLVIEVSDTSSRYDREVKLPGYAAAGIKEAWLVDLENDRVEIFTDPGPKGYRLVKILSHDETAASTIFTEVQIAVDDLLD
ncbi:Uma2 family endonuclease [soil metagenome]